MKVDVILGLQWGDEGKGKIVDVFTPRYDVIARFQGGPNAGHTIEFDGKKFILHTIPSGIFHEETVNVIGNGVIIDPCIFFREVDRLREAGIGPEKNLLISRRAHLILPTHRLLDAAYETAKGAEKIGSTLKGIGPAYTDKYARNGLRAGLIQSRDFRDHYNRLKSVHMELIGHSGFDWHGHRIDGMTFEEYERSWLDAAERLKGFTLIDSEYYLNQKLDEGKRILAEGAQGSLLDVDFGSYPFVTSSNTISAGVCAGLGVSPHRVGTIYGIFKAYCTRVGSGPFPTELHNETGETLRREGHEFGSTTGRPRRCGWLDLPALKYAIMLNGVDSLIMMKADVMNSFEKISVCTSYEQDGSGTQTIPFDFSAQPVAPIYDVRNGWNTGLDGISDFSKLPPELTDYIGFIEKETRCRVDIVSTGPDRTQTIFRNP